jgi:hypothetical protein
METKIEAAEAAATSKPPPPGLWLAPVPSLPRLWLLAPLRAGTEKSPALLWAMLLRRVTATLLAVVETMPPGLWVQSNTVLSSSRIRLVPLGVVLTRMPTPVQ